MDNLPIWPIFGSVDGLQATRNNLGVFIPDPANKQPIHAAQVVDGALDLIVRLNRAGLIERNKRRAFKGLPPVADPFAGVQLHAPGKDRAKEGRLNAKFSAG